MILYVLLSIEWQICSFGLRACLLAWFLRFDNAHHLLLYSHDALGGPSSRLHMLEDEGQLVQADALRPSPDSKLFSHPHDAQVCARQTLACYGRCSILVRERAQPTKAILATADQQ